MVLNYGDGILAGVKRFCLRALTTTMPEDTSA
jgi:hypothetical protein